MASKKSSKSKKRKQKQPQTMEELLTQTGYQLRGFSRGDEVEGVVLEVKPKALVLDIGGKSEGIVAEKVFEEAAEFIKTLKPGDKVRGTVVIPEMEGGQTLVSLRTQARQSAFDKLEKAAKSGEPVNVVGKSVVKGGLAVEALGVPGFIPTSVLGKKAAENPSKLVGSTFPAQVLEVDQAGARVILSERAVSEREQLKEVARALGKIKVGEEFEGEVSGVTNFGAFVKVKKGKVEVEGLVHISELGWEKVEKPEEVVEIGQKVKVRVLKKDEKSGRLSLSVRKTQKDPWEGVEERYKPDKAVKGKVTRISDWGFFVELEKGVEGLLHFSKIPAGMKLSEDQKIDCFVESVDEKERKISLGLVLKEKPVGYK